MFGQEVELLKSKARHDPRIADDVGDGHFAGGSDDQGQQPRNVVRSTAGGKWAKAGGVTGEASMSDEGSARARPEPVDPFGSLGALIEFRLVLSDQA